MGVVLTDLFGLAPLILLVAFVYIAWRFLRRKGNEADLAPKTGIGPALPGDGQPAITVAGCEHYRENLLQLFSEQIALERSTDDSIGEGDTVSKDIAVTLHLDDENEHDRNAVEVLVLGRRVGFLPRGLAPHFRAYLKRQRMAGKTFRCMGEIDLPLHDEDPFELRLDLPKLKVSP